MRRPRSTAVALLSGIAVLGTGCSDDAVQPTDVQLGETTFVVTVNPPVNEIHESVVPEPGSQRENVDVASGAASASTGIDGVAALADVESGTVDLWLNGPGIDAGLSQSIDPGQLVELAVAADGEEAGLMGRNDYDLREHLVVISADEPVERVEDALKEDDQVVLLEDGTYTLEDGEGTLEFQGHGLTLFGAGPRGGRVTIEGNVEVSGLDNRIRGADITGDLKVPSNTAGVAFSTVQGATEVTGDDVVLLENTFCGSVTASGSGVVALGNHGLAPLEAPEEACP